MEFITQTLSAVWNTLKNIRVTDIIDIILVAVMFYYVYRFIRERRAGKLAAGLLILLLILLLSDILDMRAMQS